MRNEDAFADIRAIADRDIVCPECLLEIDGYIFDKKIETRRGYSLRRYFGWCEKCQRGSEVIQFQEAGSDRWRLHKYRYYMYVAVGETNKKFLPDKDWRVLLELPDTPLVTIGPGGDYDKNYHLTNTIEALKRQLQKAQRSVNILQRVSKRDGIHNNKNSG